MLPLYLLKLGLLSPCKLEMIMGGASRKLEMSSSVGQKNLNLRNIYTFSSKEKKSEFVITLNMDILESALSRYMES